jgi:predicted PhzF superfamily epimerase YddE/YHI9
MGLDEDGGDLLIEVTNDCFKSLGYDNILFRELLKWDGYTRGVIVCCAASEEDEGIDFMSRFFGPHAGIDEDPVTGSAHCTLAPYFCEHVGKTDITGRQASERGGMIQCILGDGRVTIIGTAVTTMSGCLWIEKGS